MSRSMGEIDSVTPYRIVGWARDPDRPDEAVALVVTCNGETLDHIRADIPRADLAAAGLGLGAHGFDYWLPARLSPARRNVLRVFRDSDGRDLGQSPFVLESSDSFGPVLRGRLTDVLRAPMEVTALEEAVGFLAGLLDDLKQRAADERSPDDRRGVSGKSPKRRALIIDDQLPDATRDAGSVAILSHARALARLGYDVAFLPRDLGHEGHDQASFLEAEGLTLYLAPTIGSVEEVLRREEGAFDVVYIHRYPNAARYAALVHALQPLAFLIYSVADLHHLRIARQAEMSGDTGMAAEARRLRLREFLAAWRASVVITHSTVEAEILRAAVPGTPVTVVPWEAKASPVVRSFGKRRDVAFVGGYRHAPNVDAALRLATVIMPLVWRTHPAIRCALIGSDMPDELACLDGDGIDILGQVPDLFLALNRVRLTAAPLTWGAGIKGKVLESLAHGVPCVMSPVAAEGMPLPLDLVPFVAHDDEAFAQAIVALHEDEDANARCATAGLHFIATEWSEAQVDEAMRTALTGLDPIRDENRARDKLLVSSARQ